MKLYRAIELINQTLAKMRISSGLPVFNEWLLLNLSAKEPEMVHYTGPRSKVEKKMQKDIRAIETEMRQGGYSTGHFYFSQDAAGTLYDAFLVAGPDHYVIFNNTTLTMRDIAADPIWSQTQIHFVELSEYFHADALEY